MMTTEEKLEEMGRRREVYKMGYANGVKDMGIRVVVAMIVVLVAFGAIFWCTGFKVA